ncbi:flagellar biosynthetic protein FliO [Rhizomicrobium electricum]|uniref:Flagellar assembly protein FliO n=1 Tax=Rhizomicrobium electricum TaxID=480070 RepID=A0ABN1EVI0_9PROT|nr:flagellar biosynthetic protein FliO [Rhizomicrobium electricum]NIJ49506.1 flagellar protein FliO/FliZ [Rhizomicrobium electricum]
MDVLDFARYFAALLLVLGLIGAAGLATRKFGVPGLAKPAKIRRIQIVETLMLSPRQKIALIRRDDVEHMVMITPTGATVIESGITPPPPQPQVQPAPQTDAVP